MNKRKDVLIYFLIVYGAMLLCVFSSLKTPNKEKVIYIISSTVVFMFLIFLAFLYDYLRETEKIFKKYIRPNKYGFYAAVIAFPILWLFSMVVINMHFQGLGFQ